MNHLMIPCDYMRLVFFCVGLATYVFKNSNMSNHNQKSNKTKLRLSRFIFKNVAFQAFALNLVF
jgi:hypothetical protein